MKKIILLLFILLFSFCSATDSETTETESQTEFKWEETLKFPIYLGGVIGEFFGSYVLKYIWKKNLKNLKEIIE